MSEILTFSTDELTPGRDAVLENQGIPPGKAVSAEIEALCSAALGLLVKVAAPAGILREVSAAEFEAVYEGEGQNEPRTPVGEVFPQAENLALFAVTIGQRVSREITERFGSNDPALGAMLDSCASAAADKLAGVAEGRFVDTLARGGRMSSDTRVLAYSPGYCGWDISGQRELFEFLSPEQVGISLRESHLMEPLKSVSGVLIAGPKGIHDFRAAYPFCSGCRTHGCQKRSGAAFAE